MNHAVSTCLLAAIAVGLANGQQTPTFRTRTLPTDAAFGPGIIDRTIAFDLEGDGAVSLAVAKDGRLLIHDSIETRSLYRIATGPADPVVADVARLHAISYRASEDTLIAVGGGQTRLINFDGSSFNITTHPRFASADRVVTTKRDDVVWVAALDLDGDRVMFGSWGPGPNNGPQIHGAFDCSPGTEVALADWTGNGIMDAVVQTQTGIEVYGVVERGLITTQTAAQSTLRRSLVRVERADGSDDLALLSQATGSTATYLNVFEPGQPVTNTALSFDPTLIPTDATIVGLASGDIDGDDNDDLIVHSVSTEHIAALRYDAALADSYSVAASHAAVYDVGTQTDDPNAAVALLANINNGDMGNPNSVTQLDLVIIDPQQGTARLTTGLDFPLPGGALPAEADEYPPILRDDGSRPWTQASGWTSANTCSDDTLLTLQLSLPSNFDAANQLAVTVFRQPSAADNEGSAAIDKTYSNTWDLSPTSGGANTITVDAASGDFTVNVPFDDLGTTAAYSLGEIIYVELAFLGAGSGNDGTRSQTYLFAYAEGAAGSRGELDYASVAEATLWTVSDDSNVSGTVGDNDIPILKVNGSQNRRIGIIRPRRIVQPWELK